MWHRLKPAFSLVLLAPLIAEYLLGSLTFAHFFSFFQLTLMRESFYNSLYVGGMSVLISSIISLPLAYFTMRFQFRGSVLIQTLGVLPLTTAVNPSKRERRRTGSALSRYATTSDQPA